jgi:hypothetical protein
MFAHGGLIKTDSVLQTTRTIDPKNFSNLPRLAESPIYLAETSADDVALAIAAYISILQNLDNFVFNIPQPVILDLGTGSGFMAACFANLVCTSGIRNTNTCLLLLISSDIKIKASNNQLSY